MHSAQWNKNKNKEDHSSRCLYLTHHIHVCIGFSSCSFVLDVYKVLTSSDDKRIKLIRKIIKYFRDFKESRIESKKSLINNFNHWLENFEKQLLTAV